MDREGEEMKEKKTTDMIPTRQRLGAAAVKLLARQKAEHLMANWGLKNALLISAELTKLLKAEKVRRKELE